MDIKLLVTDLDDTLISLDYGISQRLIGTIAKVKEKGIKTVIATGRMHSSAFHFAEELNTAEPVISFNGALIKHMYSDDIVHHYPVDYKDAIEVLEFAKEMDKYIQYYSTDNFYVRENCPKSNVYAGKVQYKPIELKEDLIKTLDFDPTKLLMICDEDGEDIYKLAAEKFKNRLNVTRSSSTYIEFNNIKASKGNACEVLANYYGYDLRNVMAIGNGGNDVDMIKRCGIGVAVENAVAEAKEAADYVCPHQEKDGAAIAIERFLLNR